MKTAFYTKAMCLGLGMVCLNSNSQDPEFTQFYSNKVYLNPAFAGANICPQLTMNYRNQWPALSGTYVTYAATYDQYVYGLHGGLGITLLSDNAGQGTLKTNRVNVAYSYHQDIGRVWSMKLGIEAGYFQRSLDWNKLKFGDQIDDRRGFMYVTAETPGNLSSGNVDFNAGALLYSEYAWFGFSVHHLNEPDESVNSGFSPIPMRYSGHAGANINLGSSKYSDNAVLTPALMYQQQAGHSQLDLGVYVKKGKLTAGVWYRNKDAFIVSLGAETNTFNVGYSYDITTSRLANNSAGSHELSIQFTFPCRNRKPRVRAFSCPSF